jgi:hypothetical protein
MPDVGTRRTTFPDHLSDQMGYHQTTNRRREIRWMEFDDVAARDADGGLERALGSVNIELGQTNINLRPTVELDSLIKDDPQAHALPTKPSRCAHTRQSLHRDDPRTALGPRLLLPVFLCRPPLVLADCGLPTISIHLPIL